MIQATFRKSTFRSHWIVTVVLVLAIAGVIVLLLRPPVTTKNRSTLYRHQTPITDQQAIVIARDYYREKSKVDLMRYESSVEREGDLWHVRLVGNPPTPGDHCSIFVDATGRVVRFIGGE